MDVDDDVRFRQRLEQCFGSLDERSSAPWPDPKFIASATSLDIALDYAILYQDVAKVRIKAQAPRQEESTVRSPPLAVEATHRIEILDAHWAHMRIECAAYRSNIA